MPKVNYTLTEYDNYLNRWVLVQDCVTGQEAVKAKKETYLPKPNAEDVSKDNETRYNLYLDRAVFYNVTKRTLAGLLGQVYNAEPTHEIPTNLDPLVDNVDGDGVSLNQQSRKTLSNVLKKGRCGLWVDYPDNDTPATKKDLAEAKIRPTIRHYKPESIINWRTTVDGSLIKLSKVVLAERYIASDDGFKVEEADQWRELKLEEGVYTVTVWVRAENGDEFTIKEGPFMPLKSNGEPWDEIPFVFVGAENNNADIDEPPLEDLAILNVGHFRNSADYEESVYVVGQPTIYFSGLTEEWVNNVLGGTVRLGSRGGVLLPEGGNGGILQVNPNSMAFEAMEHKERQMVAVGAKLVEQSNVQRTAKEASMENASETSVLAMAANNVSRAYEQALTFALKYVDNTDTEITYQLSTDFEINSLTAQDRAQLISEWQMGAILREEMREVLEKAGIATVPFDEYQDQVDAEDLDKPLNANPNDNQENSQEEV